MKETTKDARSEPRYTLAQAARLAGTSPQNARRWMLGYEGTGHRMRPVFGSDRPAGEPLMVSFLELCELAVVARFRSNDERLPLDRLRRAHAWARQSLGLEYPFASDAMRVEGGHVLYEFTRREPGPGTMALDLAGQWLLPVSVAEVLERFDFDRTYASRWFPAGRAVPLVIDPERGSGLPTIAGRNLRADFLAGRWRAGEDIASLAEDYDLDVATVEAALRAAA